MDGIRLQVTQAYNALRNAQSSRDTTERQLKASEESYRVRRELFRAGRATSAELTDAEMDLMKSRFEALNARIDLRVARANLEYALGRQPQPSRP
jgi:outer membrane protein TolC